MKKKALCSKSSVVLVCFSYFNIKIHLLDIPSDSTYVFNNHTNKIQYIYISELRLHQPNAELRRDQPGSIQHSVRRFFVDVVDEGRTGRELSYHDDVLSFCVANKVPGQPQYAEVCEPRTTHQQSICCQRGPECEVGNLCFIEGVLVEASHE